MSIGEQTIYAISNDSYFDVRLHVCDLLLWSSLCQKKSFGGARFGSQEFWQSTFCFARVLVEHVFFTNVFCGMIQLNFILLTKMGKKVGILVEYNYEDLEVCKQCHKD